jgi:hypothetical protein
MDAIRKANFCVAGSALVNGRNICPFSLSLCSQEREREKKRKSRVGGIRLKRPGRLQAYLLPLPTIRLSEISVTEVVFHPKFFDLHVSEGIDFSLAFHKITFISNLIYFICGLLKGAVRSSDYITSNGRMTIR